jgi:hypothetical protein
LTYNVTSFDLYSRIANCEGNECTAYGYEVDSVASDTIICAGFLGTRVLYTYNNDAGTAVGNMASSGVRYMFSGTDYTMFGNTSNTGRSNTRILPLTSTTNITNTSPNNGLYVYGNSSCD